MEKPSLISPRLPYAPFTLSEAKAAGLQQTELWRRTDIHPVSRGLYRPVEWDFDLAAAARSLSAASPGAWISHVTAARLQGLFLPPWLSDSNELHLSKPRKLPPVRRKGVVGHTVLAFDGEIEETQGIRMTTRSRTWLDLATQLPLYDLICVGDQLIRVPRPELEGRTAPYATPAELRTLLDRHRGRQGVVRAREAFELMRVGADSAPETRLRLAMLDAGLPEPELQVKLRVRDPFSPTTDLGFRARRLAIQYDGGHHLEEEQILSDMRRDKAFRAAGWTVLVFDKDDAGEDFVSATKQIKKALRTAWMDPSVESGFARG
ncbi:endonuclease domain-containing protein [Paenarthrobacter sp. PAE-2]|nr:endonuclease domain-containing protein [Paenarthrobacter sp. PAE-2]